MLLVIDRTFVTKTGWPVSKRGDRVSNYKRAYIPNDP